jgi:hypothetical protein
MYCSKKDSLIYGKNIPLYRILYIKKSEIKNQKHKKKFINANKINDNFYITYDNIRKCVKCDKTLCDDCCKSFLCYECEYSFCYDCEEFFNVNNGIYCKPCAVKLTID